MAEELMVYEPGDRFATISMRGEVKIWRVEEDGYINSADPISDILDRYKEPGPLGIKHE